MDRAATVAPRRRVAGACEYCRLKKLKCDEQRPSCQNCSTQRRECIHKALSHKPRSYLPTRRRIETLEEENRRLRSLAHGLGEDGRGRQASRTPDDSPQECTEAAEKTPEDGAVHHYHGPTSAIFELSPDDPGQSPSRPSEDQCAASMLYAETARQRHLEQINLGARTLDFDGVEPDLAIHLLSIYWSRQLHTGLIVYRPLFMRDMACNGPYFSKLLLNAIFYSSSKHSSRAGVRRDPEDKTTAGWLFRKRFRELLIEEFDKSKITTIQALLIMAVSLFSRCDERSTSWLYAGNAFNMVIDLGLHAIPSGSRGDKSYQAAEIRKRVFWGAYVLDKTQCLLQGRPPILRISDADISISFLDNYEELEPFDCSSFTENWAHGAAPLRNMSNMRSLCELCLIMERILTNLYGGNFATRDLGTFYMEAAALQIELENWRKHHSPLTNDFLNQKVPPLPHQLTILALYNVLIILLRRPLIVGNDQPSPDGLPRGTDIAYESYAACHRAANQIVLILDSYRQYYPITSSPYLLSYATYISATIFVRMPALHSDQTDIQRSLNGCIQALDEHCHLYAAARRTKSAIDVLMQQMRENNPSPAYPPVRQESVLNPSNETSQLPPSAYVTPTLDSSYDPPQGLQQEADREAVIRSFAANFMGGESFNGADGTLGSNNGGLDFSLGVQHFGLDPFDGLFA